MNALYMNDFIKQVPVKGNKSKMTHQLSHLNNYTCIKYLNA